MLFDLLDKLLVSKKKIDINIGDETVHPYIINRWVSMYSPQMATIINSTGNWLYNIFDNDSNQYFNFLQRFLPRLQSKRIFYIKKAKKEDNKDQEEHNEVKLLASNLELSEREIKLLLEYERQHRPTNTD
tara:strand:+ start:823 stop:1212 length:390 start_codon:yes stop_codon:yes gene_type:complete